MNLIDAGIQLMLIGMGTVFVFLTALVGVTTMMSAAVTRLLPEEAQPIGVSGPTGDPGDPSDEELAAIAAAIAIHRQT